LVDALRQQRARPTCPGQRRLPRPFYTGGADHTLIDTLGQTTRTGRGAKPDEIAQVIAFLLSEKASWSCRSTAAARLSD